MNKKKFLSLIMALVMLVGVFSPLTALAAGESTDPNAKTNTVVLHKILQTADNMKAKNAEGKDVFPGQKGIDGTDYDGNAIKSVEGYFGTGSKPIAGVFFAVQNAEGKYLGTNGQALADNLQNPKAEGFEAAVLGGRTTTDGLRLNTSVLEQKNTDYKIVEIVELSTYKSDDGKLLAAKKAVPVEITLPITNNNGVVTEAHVYPKNTDEKPSIDKNFAKDHGLTVIEDEKKNNNAGADYKNYEAKKAKVTAELGKEVPYEVKTKVNAGSQYKTLNWKDTMTNGLTFLPDSLELKTTPDLKLVKGTDYKVTADDRGFTLSITEDGFKKINVKTHPETGNGEDVEFTLTYKAKVNKNAVQDIPEKNDIKLEYSNNPKKEKEPTPVTPQNGELKVTKTWDGKGETEEAQVVYTLSNGTKSYSVMLDGKKTEGTVDLGDGITFEITGAYAGTFKGLTGEGWNISERVAGYDETITATTGNAAITNKKDTENPTPLNPTEPQVEYYGKRFVKADATDGTRLQGAEFVIKNSAGKFLALKDITATEGEGKTLADAKKAYDEAVKAWNDAVKANPDTADDQIKVTIGEEEITGKTNVMAKIAELQGTYETAFKKAKNAYEWVDSQDAANIVKLISDAQGKFEIVGLEKGTYKLVETKTPGNYAKINDQEFTVGPETYSKHEDGVVYSSDDKAIKVGEGNISEAQRIDNKKVTIPQTGGMGTVLFTIVGISLMAGAVVAMKRNREEA